MGGKCFANLIGGSLFPPLTSHAVNHRHHRLDVRTCLEHKSDGKRIAAKIPVIDGLLDAVVEDLEILLGKIENEFAVPVSDRNRNDHFVGADADLVLCERWFGHLRWRHAFIGSLTGSRRSKKCSEGHYAQTEPTGLSDRPMAVLQSDSIVRASVA